MSEERRLTKEQKKKLGLVFFCASLVAFAVLLVVSANIAVAMTFEGRMYRNVVVAGIPVGGMDKTTATTKLQETFEKMIAEGLSLELYGETHAIDLSPQGATDPDLVYPLLDADITAAVDAAYNAGRGEKGVASFFGPLWYTTFGKKVISASVNVAQTRLSDAIRTAFPNAESPGSPTDFVIEGTEAPFTVTVSEAVPGAVLDLPSAYATVSADAADFELSLLHLSLIERSAIITKGEAETLIPDVERALQNAPYTLTFTNEYGERMEFTVSKDDLLTWLLPSKHEAGFPILTLDTVLMDEFLDTIHEEIDISAQNAVFVVESDRVTAFSPSREGLRADDDALLDSLTSAFQSGAHDVAISVMRTEPEITTEESNSFGIKEPLGSGISKYGGSPTNRRANIAHGVEKLQGILVAPGETLSLLEKLSPFTVADGYLPELVIKGDEIKPEVGGGLCQIGTTTFRAAMNSGLEIVERRNHSLVVSYYNDLSNGKPGTDATIYDPAPDLKIMNDTPAYILFVTENDTKTSTLTFSFWGTSDGRKGSYTAPVVLSWASAGETQTKETDSLPPGETQCQSGHPGATTTFTYNITLPDGTIKSREFPSTYRALPQICLVGVDPNAPPLPETAGATDTGSPLSVEEPIPLE